MAKRRKFGPSLPNSVPKKAPPRIVNGAERINTIPGRPLGRGGLVDQTGGKSIAGPVLKNCPECGGQIEFLTVRVEYDR